MMNKKLNAMVSIALDTIREVWAKHHILPHDMDTMVKCDKVVATYEASRYGDAFVLMNVTVTLGGGVIVKLFTDYPPFAKDSGTTESGGLELFEKLITMSDKMKTGLK